MPTNDLLTPTAKYAIDYGKIKFMPINYFSTSVLKIKLPTSASIFDHFHKLKKTKKNYYSPITHPGSTFHSSNIRQF